MKTARRSAPDGRSNRGSEVDASGSLSLRLVAAAVLTLLLSAFTWSSPASACPVTDPSCVLKDAQKVVDDTVDKAEKVFQDTTETVDETVDKVQKEASGAVDTVEDTVEDVVGKPPDTPTDPTDPTKPTDPGKPHDPQDPPGTKGDPRTRVKGAEHLRERGGQSGSGAGSAAGLGASRLLDPFGPRTPSSQTLESLAATPTKPPLDAFGQTVLDAAKQFAFPLLLTILVGVFLAVQSRIDRRAPKLALAPLDQDLLSFE